MIKVNIEEAPKFYEHLLPQWIFSGDSEGEKCISRV